MGSLVIEEKYKIDKVHECRQVFRTDNVGHPGVAKVKAQGAVNIGGRVRAFSEGPYRKHPQTYFSPAQTRDLFEQRVWSTVAALQFWKAPSSLSVVRAQFAEQIGRTVGLGSVASAHANDRSQHQRSLSKLILQVQLGTPLRQELNDSIGSSGCR